MSQQSQDDPEASLVDECPAGCSLGLHTSWTDTLGRTVISHRDRRVDISAPPPPPRLPQKGALSTSEESAGSVRKVPASFESYSGCERKCPQSEDETELVGLEAESGPGCISLSPSSSARRRRARAWGPPSIFLQVLPTAFAVSPFNTEKI